MARVFVIYERRLFNDILASILGSENLVSAIERASSPLTSIVEQINSVRPNIVILESEADGNTVWHILLASTAVKRLILLDLDKGIIREYGVQTYAVSTLKDLLGAILPE